MERSAAFKEALLRAVKRELWRRRRGTMGRVSAGAAMARISARSATDPYRRTSRRSSRRPSVSRAVQARRRRRAAAEARTTWSRRCGAPALPRRCARATATGHVCPTSHPAFPTSDARTTTCGRRRRDGDEEEDPRPADEALPHADDGPRPARPRPRVDADPLRRSPAQVPALRRRGRRRAGGPRAARRRDRPTALAILELRGGEAATTRATTPTATCRRWVRSRRSRTRSPTPSGGARTGARQPLLGFRRGVGGDSSTDGTGRRLPRRRAAAGRRR